VTESLLDGGVSAVVTFQGPLSGTASGVFCGAFYRGLVGDEGVDRALAAARGALELAVPPLNPWLPTLTLTIPPEAVLPIRFAVTPSQERAIMAQPMAKQRSSFVDRVNERRLVAKWIEGDERLLLVTGEPGIGKSALVQACLTTRALQGGNVAYVDLDGPRRQSVWHVPRLIADELAASPVHGKENAEVFASYAAELRDATGSSFLALAAALERLPQPPVVALDHLAGLDDLRRLIDIPSRTLLILGPKEAREIASDARTVQLSPFPAESYVELIRQFLEAQGLWTPRLLEVLHAMPRPEPGPWDAREFDRWRSLAAELGSESA
jgi:hypothetical protein